MANYEVVFETDVDTQTNGRKAHRRMYVEARSPKEAVAAAVPRIKRLAEEGFCTVLFLRGSVERDTYSGAANTQVAGFRSTFGVRRGGQFSQPTWEFAIRPEIGFDVTKGDVVLKRVQ